MKTMMFCYSGPSQPHRHAGPQRRRADLRHLRHLRIIFFMTQMTQMKAGGFSFVPSALSCG